MKALVSILGVICAACNVAAQTPALLTYQGRLAVGANGFNGAGQFKFALVSPGALSTHWKNSADANSDGEPDAAVTLNVSNGLYSLAIGDANLANMASLPPSVFTNSAVYLRVWFNDGAHGFQRLTPDQRVTAAGYAMMAANVPDGTMTLAKLAPETVAAIEAGQVGSIATLQNALSALTARVQALESASLTPSGLTVVSSDSGDPNLTAQGYIQFSTVPAPAWVTGATPEASARRWHSGVWSGDRFIVWGGDAGAASQTGGLYDPVANQWTEANPTDAPAARFGHTAIWTGTRMVVWGGLGSQFEKSGGIFNASSQQWTATKIGGAPDARDSHVAVWTGARMVIWGGQNGALLTSGGLFDPVANSWTTLAVAGAPDPRIDATAVWAGDGMVVWGGKGIVSGVVDELNSGGRLLLTSGMTPTQWLPITASGAPTPRVGHTAIWTGSRMIVWGGRNGGTFFNDGAAYDPINNTWAPINATGAPLERGKHAAVWTGTEMLIYGGENSVGALSSAAAYNPTTGKWRALSGQGSPIARAGAAATWTGTELLVFGGYSGSTLHGALQRLDPQPAWHFFRKP